LAEIVRGWRRIYLGVLTRSQMLGCALSILVGSLLPFALLFFTAGRVWNGAGGWWLAWCAAGLVHLLALAATSIRFFSLARCRLRYLLLYPISCVGVLAILALAVRRTFGVHRLEWRGCEYEVASATIRS
jgi:hypothetical protein